MRGSRGRNCAGEGEFRGFSRSRREHVDQGNMMFFNKLWGPMGYRNPKVWLTPIDRDAPQKNTVRSIKCQENETIKWGSKIVKRPKCSLTLLSLKMMWRYTVCSKSRATLTLVLYFMESLYIELIFLHENIFAKKVFVY